MGRKFDDDLLATPSLAKRLHGESAFETGYPTGYWLIRQRSNGETYVSHKGYAPNLAEQIVAGELVKALNKHLPEGGAWVVAWVGWGTKCIALWLDPDGDIQFTVEIEEDATGIYEAGLDHWVEQCADAWRLWYVSMRAVLDPSFEDQTFKKAQGQRAPSAGTPANDDVPDLVI